MVVMALLIALIVVLMVRRIARPMTQLASAADRLGRGEDIPPLPAEGPPELRRTTEAFNAMRTRLKRYVEDRDPDACRGLTRFAHADYLYASASRVHRE